MADPPVRMEQLAHQWMDFLEIWYLNIFENLSWKFAFRHNLIRITSTLHEHLCPLMAHRFYSEKEKYFMQKL
jgi:hypothetical protein